MSLSPIYYHSIHSPFNVKDCDLMKTSIVTPLRLWGNIHRIDLLRVLDSNSMRLKYEQTRVLDIAFGHQGV